MAAKKVTEIKDGNDKVVTTLIEDNIMDIMYEETLTTVKEPGKPRFYKLNKMPYLDFGGHKVFLSKDEVEQIRAGILNPQDILDDIPVEEVYKA